MDPAGEHDKLLPCPDEIYTALTRGLENATYVTAMRSVVEDQIATTLHRCRELHPESSRRLLLSRVERHAGTSVHVADYPTPLQWFIGFVEACGNGSAGIFMILPAVRSLGLDSLTMDSLAQLRDEWEAAPTAAEAAEPLWSRLRAELQEVDEPTALSAFQAVYDGWLPMPPPHCRNGWHVLLHLAGRNSTPDGLPAYIPYLESVIEYLSPQTAVQVERWNHRRAHELGLTRKLNEAKYRRDPRLRQEKRTVHLIFQFESDRDRPDACYMSWWRQWDEKSPTFEVGARSRLVPLDDIERSTEDAVTSTEKLLADREDDVVIEFIMSNDLMYIPVEHWRLESHSPLPRRLGHHYVLAVRSLERLRSPHWRRAWRRRWRRLQEAPPSVRTCRSRPGADHLRLLETALVKDENLVAVVLSGPVTPEHTTASGELEIALRCGVPVVLWHRGVPPSPHAADAVKDFAEVGGLSQLPQRARDLRLAAHVTADAESNSYAGLGEYLAVLWDDPDRRPECGPSDFLPPRGEMVR